MAKSDTRQRAPVSMGELLPPPVVAERLGVQILTLADWRLRGRGPGFVKVGRLVRYPSTFLDAWLAQHLHQQDTDAA